MNNSGETISRHSSIRTPVPAWSLRVIGLLLIVEAASLIGFGVVTSQWFTWKSVVGTSFVPERATPAIISGIFVPLGIAALVAVFGLLARLRVGWLLAMLVQAGILLTCLHLYVEQRPSYIYPLMLCSIITVLYLNSLDVRVAFQTGTAARLARRMEVLDES